MYRDVSDNVDDVISDLTRTLRDAIAEFCRKRGESLPPMLDDKLEEIMFGVSDEWRKHSATLDAIERWAEIGQRIEELKELLNA